MSSIQNTNNNLSITEDTIFYLDAPGVVSFLEGNRKIKKDHVARLKGAMSSGSFIPPILIDINTLCIVDGNHRYQAAGELWAVGSDYKLAVIAHSFASPLDAARIYNCTQKRWVLKDYIDSYVFSKEENYLKLEDFVKNHSDLSYTAAAQLLTGFNKPRLASGQFKTDDEQIKRANNIYNEILQMIQTTNDPDLLKSTIILSYARNRDMFISKAGSFNRWLKLLKRKYKKPITEKLDLYTTAYLHCFD